MFPIAEFTPFSPQAQLAAVSALGLALLVLTIRTHLRRQPPLDSELVKLNGSIESLQEKVNKLEEHREKDLHAQRTYTRESSERIFTKLDDLKDSLNANMKSVENRLGRVDGSIEQLTAQINRTRPPFA